MEIKSRYRLLPLCGSRRFQIHFMLRSALLFIIIISNALKTSSQSLDSSLVVSARAGWGKERFSWSIAGDLQGPNILSELKWKNSGMLFDMQADVPFYKNFFLRGGLDHMRISSGTAEDSDYAGNDRTNASYQKEFESSSGHAYTWDLAAGLRLRVGSSMQLSASIGYAQSHQSLYLESNESPLRSGYRTVWKGGILGLEGEVKLSPRFNLALQTRYRQMQYKGTGNWSLVAAFAHPVSFIQRARGYALDYGAGLKYLPSTDWAFHLSALRGYWSTGKGTDELFLADGRTPITRFNGAERKTINISIGIIKAFRLHHL